MYKIKRDLNKVLYLYRILPTY